MAPWMTARRAPVRRHRHGRRDMWMIAAQG
jgi:hypothetical protein